MTRIRIFISSPGDVAAERDKARLVIEQLVRHYGEQVELIPVLWEDLPLQADSSFQQGIDLVLSHEHGIDIAVFILWNRLGSPLGGSIRRANGSEYRSGTEREFELMLEARHQSGGRRPALIAYARSDAQGFLDRLKGEDTAEIEAALAQRKLAEGFIREHFHDPEGHNVRAYHSFSDPITFASRLRVHLRGLIDELLGSVAPAAQWTAPPYRGLALFDLEHAPIFRGREEEICELGLLLRRRAEQEHCAFVVVVGSSGSGKSSLVRAGLAANLLSDNVDAEVSEWRCAVMLPSGANGDPIASLARALTPAGALPELLTAGHTSDVLAEALRTAPRQALKLAIEPAFAAAARAANGAVRLLLIVDQLEELHTDPRIDGAVRTQFLELLEMLARSGPVAVVATLRSDFYPLLQKEEAFLRLKGREGQFDLGAPSLAAMRRIVVEPAQIAGLRFEQRAGHARLEDRLLTEAAELSDALPLVEFALRELYEQRDGTLMTIQAYEAMGGVKGAIGTRAEAVFMALPAPAQDAFAAVFRQLVTLDRTEPARRWCPREAIARSAAAETLVERFVAERFLSAAHDEREPVVGIAHEALLRSWPRLAAFIEASRDALRKRGRLELAHARWLEQPDDSSLLLQAGRPLREAEELTSEMPDIVPAALAQFIAQSRAHHDAVQAERRRRKRRTVASVATLSLLAVIGGALAWLQQREAALAHQRAEALHWIHQGDGLLERDEWPAALSLYETAWRANPDFATRSALLRGLLAVDPHLSVAFHGLAAPVQALDFADDGSLWTGNGNGALSTYDLSAVSCVRCDVPPPESTVDVLTDALAVHAARDGGALAVLRDGRVVRMGTAASLQEVGARAACPSPASCEVQAAAISADGKRLVVSDAEQSQALFRMSDGDQSHLIDSPDQSRIMALALDGNGDTAVLGTEQGGVYRWDLSTRQTTVLRAANGVRVTALAWGAGDRIAAADVRGDVVVFGPGAEASIQIQPQGAAVTKVAWDPTGARLAISTGNEVRVFDVQGNGRTSSTPPLELHAHRGAVRALGWSDDGQRLASSSDDRSLHVWQLEPDRTVIARTTIAGTQLLGLAATGDGKLIATGTADGRVCVWSAPFAQTPACLAGAHRTDVTALAWHPRESLLISADESGVIRAWNWPSPQFFTPASAAGVSHAHRGAVWTLRWTADGTTLLSSGHDRDVKAWDRATDTARTLAQLPDLALGMDLSADGSLFAAASTDGIIRVWPMDDRSGRPAFTLPATRNDPGHRGSVGALAFIGDGSTLLSGGNDGTLRVWDLATGRARAVSPSIGANLQVEGITQAGDGRAVASVGSDGQLRVWDAATLEPLMALTVHRGPAWRVVWSEDAKQFASSSSDGTLAAVTWSEEAWLARLQALLGTRRSSTTDH